jgi:alkylation response protein AidB-like acyl-CoA dehydrogenase
MDFSLTETQGQLKGLVARIFSEQVSQERLRSLDSTGYYDAALWTQLSESGFLGVTLTSDMGGVDEDFETLCVLLEEAGRSVAPVPLFDVLVSGAFALQTIDQSPAVEAALRNLVSGEGVVCAALHEADQQNLLTVKTQARFDGQHWLLSGSKQQVPVADKSGACWTLANTQEGLGVFLFDLQAPEIVRTRQVITSGEYQYQLDLTQVSAELLIGGSEVETFVERAVLHGMAACSAMAVGVCAEMTRMAALYTTEREQFGKPLATFQAVAHQLADCHINTEALRGLAQQAVCLLNQQGVGNAAREAAWVAKIFAADALHRVSHATQQVHGGTGVDRDYPLFRYCLLAKKLELLCGSQGALLQQLGKALTA